MAKNLGIEVIGNFVKDKVPVSGAKIKGNQVRFQVNGVEVFFESKVKNI